MIIPGLSMLLLSNEYAEKRLYGFYLELGMFRNHTAN